jgi:tRNA modification GTPase
VAETIFAQATPPGRSGVAIVRISGPEAFAAAAALGAGAPPIRRASLRRLRDPATGEPMDDAIVLRFAAPASFTGEDCVELHLHGGPGVVRAVAEALAGRDGLRQAEPGEFTRRAVTNGRIDLAQAEGLADLLAAETGAQARQALALVDGRLSALATDWRARLVRTLALLEAAIDFSDEDLPQDVLAQAAAEVTGLRAQVAAELVGSAMAERVRLGFDVALVGPPNAGKSTLLNRLAGRQAAITSEIAGTTRDAIEVRMDLAGLPVTLVDTAGLRPAGDPVEALGVDLARRRAAAADLRVFLVESAADVARLGLPPAPGDQVVLAKLDLRPTEPGAGVSGLTGAGVDALVARIGEELGRRAAGAGLANRERHRVALERAQTALDGAAVELAFGPAGADLAAAEVQLAVRALDFLVGKVDVEGVLDEIFSSFCIGK